MTRTSVRCHYSTRQIATDALVRVPRGWKQKLTLIYALAILKNTTTHSLAQGERARFVWDGGGRKQEGAGSARTDTAACASTRPYKTNDGCTRRI